MFKVVTIKKSNKFDFQEECELYLNNGYKMASSGYAQNAFEKAVSANDKHCWWAVFTLEKPEG